MPSLIITDERVLRAIAYIEGKLHTSQTLDEVAREVCLSPSRFRHVFVEATGMALRPYVLWRRFLYVWELLAAGTSLSKAAHDASFADAAHLPRTSRTMFDFPPSALHIERPVAAPVVSSIRAGAQTTIRIPRPILGLRRPLSDRIVG